MKQLRRRLWNWISGHPFPGFLVGRLKYARFRKASSPRQDAFNGQAARRRLFQSIVETLAPGAIVETGTHLGTTTAFMSETGLPVFTAEAHARFFGFARARLAPFANVVPYFGDSRAVLEKLFAGRLRNVSYPVFFYLDAHWYQDLPLEEELRIVFAHCPAAVVMIDDFAVPFDPGYGYDNYGPGKALTPAYIAAVVAAEALQVFYPATPAAEETGLRRGCVVLAKDRTVAARLAALPLLRAAA